RRLGGVPPLDPTGHGHAGHAPPARDVRAGPRLLREADRAGRARSARVPTSAAGRRDAGPARPGRMARVADEPADGPRDGQPRLAAGLRPPAREDPRGLPPPGPAAD